MHLNHLNLTVPDVEETKTFLQTYFGLVASGGDPRPGFALLRDDGDMVLTLLEPASGREVRYPPTFHIGFIQPTEAAVDDLHRRLVDAGHAVPAPRRFHGSWTFYFTAPGGFLIEVLA